MDLPWSPVHLRCRRRAQLSGPATAAEALTLRLRRLRAKLEQLALRGAMPPPIRADFRSHVGVRIAHCAGQVGAPAHAAVVVDRAAARAPPRPAPVAPRREGAVPPAGAPSHGGRRRRQPHARTEGFLVGAVALVASARLPRPSATRARSGSAPPLASVRAYDELLGRSGARRLPSKPRAAVDLLWATPFEDPRCRACVLHAVACFPCCRWPPSDPP